MRTEVTQIERGEKKQLKGLNRELAHVSEGSLC